MPVPGVEGGGEEVGGAGGVEILPGLPFFGAWLPPMVGGQICITSFFSPAALYCPFSGWNFYPNPYHFLKPAVLLLVKNDRTGLLMIFFLLVLGCNIRPAPAPFFFFIGYYCKSIMVVFIRSAYCLFMVAALAYLWATTIWGFHSLLFLTSQ